MQKIPGNPPHKTVQAVGGQVLLLEDDLLLAKYFGQMLGAVGVEDVLIAHDNNAAIDLINNSNIVAAFVDIGMKLGTSEKTAQVLVEHAIPFAFVSGQPLSDSLKKAFPDADVLIKPARKAQIEATLEALGYKAIVE